MKVKYIKTLCGCEIKNTIKVINNNKCRKCNNIFCQKHLYIYVDESNISITKNSPLLCENCYKEKYKPYKNTFI